LVSIGEMGGDAQASLTSDTHTLDTVLEAGYHATLADAERIELVLLDLLTAIEKEVVADFDSNASISGRPIADLDVFVLDAAATAFHCHGAPILEFSGCRRQSAGTKG
jgi:hypothetical protein